MNKFEYLIAESRSQFSFGKLLSVGMKNVSITNTGAQALRRQAAGPNLVLESCYLSE